MSTPAWLQQAVRVDPTTPPGVLVLRSGIDQAIHAGDYTQWMADHAISDQVAEDCRSVIESAEYVVRYREAGESIRCECCGTMVALMPEGAAAGGPGRTWKPGIWEAETLRKHTLRRCEWTRTSSSH